MGMLDEKYAPDDIMLQMYRGERLPTAEEQWTIAKSIRRTQLKDRNALHRQMWEYESDDDEGEDMGDRTEEANLDEAAAGELGEGGEKKEGAASGGKEDKDGEKEEPEKKKK